MLVHRERVLWGEQDGRITRADLMTMAAAVPSAFQNWHSMNLEAPALYVGFFGAWFGRPAK